MIIGPEAVRVVDTASDRAARMRVVEQGLARRGPDEIAWSHTAEAIVASARLVHWEEGAATQPFIDPDGGFGVFNGELFNLMELQERVARPGASEIEVLVAGLRREGNDFFAAIDGQFAAVLRPGSDASFLAVRDRFGIAPLYVAEVEGGVALASNLQSLTALAGLETALSVPGLRTILATWAPTDGSTAVVGVEQVAPGELVVVAADGTSRREPWASAPVSPAPDAMAESRRLADAAAALDIELETALRASVRCRIRSTTPVSCLVSGGIDSTIIAALAADLGVRSGVALALEGDDGHDGVAARQRRVADAVGLDLLQHTLTPAETVEVFEHYVATRRVPLVRLGPVGMTALARRARHEGCRAVLSGEGADELFAGYDSYRILAARSGLLGPVADLDWSAFGEPEFDADRGPRWARSYWRSLVRLTGGTPTSRADLLRPVAGLLAPDLFTQSLALEVPMPGTPAPLPSDPAAALYRRREEDVRDLLGAYLLTIQGDHAWMEEAVELRPPYLARGVADLALSRSPADFVDVSGGKRPIRRLLARLATDRPALAGLDFAKAAFRVDVRFLLRDPIAFDRLTDHVTAAPPTLLDVDGVLDRAAACRRAGTCSEAESMLFTFAASLGVLGARTRGRSSGRPVT